MTGGQLAFVSMPTLDLGATFNSLPSILGAVTVVVLVIAAAYGTWKRDDAKTLRENNSDLSARVSILEADKARLTADGATLQGENTTLRGIVTGEVKLAVIEDVLEQHDRDTRAWQAKADVTLEEIRRAVERRPK